MEQTAYWTTYRPWSRIQIQNADRDALAARKRDLSALLDVVRSEVHPWVDYEIEYELDMVDRVLKGGVA